MADANALTYDQLLTDVLGNRFTPATSGYAQRWLAVAYQDVWDAAPWTFKQVSRATFYTTADGLVGGAASATPLMPTAFAAVRRLYDDQGDRLQELDPDDFEDEYTPVTSTGRPECFSVLDRQIRLGPAPSTAYAFKLSYRRRLAHKNTAGAVVAGFFVATTDYPLWDDHHRILVPRAQVVGLKEKNDPSWPPLWDEYQNLLRMMTRDYTERVVPRQWPAYSP